MERLGGMWFQILPVEVNRIFMILSLILFGTGIGCYSAGQLAQHGKLRWGYNNPDSFFHPGSWRNKYKKPLQEGPDNWYYRFFKLVHKEKFPGSATFLVSVTDFYHLSQSAMFIFFSLSLSLATDINFFYVWIGILLINFTAYRLFSK